MNFLIHQYLEQHASASPNREAVECLDKTLSYQELAIKSNQLANCLIEKGLSRGDRVAIYMDKCIEMSVAIYGILKAGAAYVPLDPTAPKERLVSIIHDCGIQFVLSAQSKAKKIGEISRSSPHAIQVIGPSVDTGGSGIIVSWEQLFDSYSSQAPSQKIVESDLAYIIYTSGSTGIPKGIMHTHHSCLAYSTWAADEYQLNTDDRIGNHSPLHFDISIFDWFAGVVAGACTVVIPDEYTKFPASYSQLIADTKLTVLFTVPFALIQLLLRGALEERDLSSLRWVIFGGEPFPLKHLKELMNQLDWVSFDNMYGPAEVNGCTHYTLDSLPTESQSIPIGPINQISECLVVDEDNEPLGSGHFGELLVRTPSMMQGYWGREDLNLNAFFFTEPESQCSASYQHRYYRTGDLVTLDEQGTLWFIGRKDRQVKVRGYRVELDEIEAALVDFPAIEEAAVFVQKKDDNTALIFASYTVKNGQRVELKEVNRFLKGKLPQYALPTNIQAREEFPRTTSGKIDRNSLQQEVTND